MEAGPNANLVAPTGQNRQSGGSARWPFSVHVTGATAVRGKHQPFFAVEKVVYLKFTSDELLIRPEFQLRLSKPPVALRQCCDSLHRHLQAVDPLLCRPALRLFR